MKYRYAIAGGLALCLVGAGGDAQDVRPSIFVSDAASSTDHALSLGSGTVVAVVRDAVANVVRAATSKDGGLTWSTPLVVSDDVQGNLKQLAADAVHVSGKDVRAFWFEQVGGGLAPTGSGVHMAHSSDGGATFADILLPMPTGPGYVESLDADVVSSGGDDLVAAAFVWVGTQGVNVHLVASDPADADAFLPPLAVSSTTANFQELDVAVLDDEVHLVWSDDRSPDGDYDVWYRRSLDGGSSWADPAPLQVNVGDPPFSFVSGRPRVLAWDPGSGLQTRVLVLWRESGSALFSTELYAALSLDGGASFLPVLSVSGPALPGEEVVDFDVCRAGDDEISVVYAKNTQPSSSLYSVRSSSSGLGWSGATLVASGGAASPRIAAADDGSVVAGWTDAATVPRLLAAVSVDGLAWGLPLELSDVAGEGAAVPRIAFDPACANFVVNWSTGGLPDSVVRSGGFLVGDCSCFFPVGAKDDPLDFERDYTPPELEVAGIASHPRQRLTVFYPHPSMHERPADGWPVLMYSPAGAFAEATAIGSEGSALRAICGEPPADSTTSNTLGLRILNDALHSGFAVITVGSVGWNSGATSSGASPNLFYDPLSTFGMPYWNDYGTFYGEKDMTWARQYVAEYADAWDGAYPPLEIDNDRVFVMGVSTGGIYSAFVALGPDRARTDAGSQLARSTRCAGAIVLASPTWFPAFAKELFGYHWPDMSAATLRAETVERASRDALVASSISTWIRQPGSHAATTPAFFAFDEPIASTDFERMGAEACADPVLEDALPPVDPETNEFLAQIHDSWFGLVGFEDLRCADQDHQSWQSRLWIAEDVDTSQLPSDQARLPSARYAGRLLGDPLQDELLAWLLETRASSSIRDEPGPGGVTNPACYATLTPPVLGGAWRSRVDGSGAAPSLSTLLAYDDAYATPLLFRGFVVYPRLSSSLLVTDYVTEFEAEVAYHELDVPNSLDLLGLTIYTQAALSGGGLRLCNGVDLVLGR